MRLLAQGQLEQNPFYFTHGLSFGVGFVGRSACQNVGR
jgi:hypothetical protein